ncbi:MAG TPA: 8-amino-7-oxononanoate synthase [Spirochaetota bacterium]|jgi:8-amino-7-oxononanoate synthase|nr:MAG: 8-amino-7-oxononanoate synthase [Spirochaetes bacterium ADurb.Bin133]HNZ26950.1 8-amino-7-oxononanoate synthase [Spirochaetota bacterium]HPY87385.1 8-amino-7-oxononanoate synthase [Spirochaetota bacterium]
MIGKWGDILAKKLNEKKNRDNYRALNSIDKTEGKYIEINNKKYINFSNNDYLGLTKELSVISAGNAEALKWGAGTGASRLVSGTFTNVSNLEKKFAGWNKKARALMFNSGYNANIGIVSALADEKTVVFCDKLNHASIYDGIFLSKAKIERYPHKDVEFLEKLLIKNRDVEKKIIITDSVFSMEGDIAPLIEIAELSQKYETLLIADEAHSAGLFGNDYAGITSMYNLQDKVDVIIGTLGKSFGAFGAFAACDEILYDYFINSCRSFIFTTSLPPFIIGALNRSYEIILTENRGKEVLLKAENFAALLKENGVDVGASRSQIVPIIVKSNSKSIELMNFLKEKGIYAPSIRPPTVPPNASRVRISITYLHTDEDISKLSREIINWSKKNV